MKEPGFIVCYRVSYGREPTAGSTITNCSTCDAAIWIAPTSVQLMAEYEAKVICVECALAADPNMLPQPPTPEQIREIKASLGRES